MKLILILLAVSARCLTPEHHTMEDGRQRERIPLKYFKPPGTGRHSRKHIIPFGDDNDPIDLLVDKIPVEVKIEAIDQLKSCFKRKSMIEIVGTHLVGNSEMVLYMKYLIASSLLVAEAVKILFRSVFRKPNFEEAQLMTIADMTMFIRNRFRDNRSMQVLTPRMLREWQRLAHKPGTLRLELDNTILEDVTRDDVPIPPETIICLELSSFRHSLSIRQENLQLTGYDHITL